MYLHIASNHRQPDGLFNSLPRLTTKGTPKHIKGQRPVSLNIFASNWNLIKTSPCCNSIAGQQIATNFCTCHDSRSVVSCTKFCSDQFARIEVRVKRNFHRIWIAMENSLVKRGLIPRIWLLFEDAMIERNESKFVIWISKDEELIMWLDQSKGQ